MTKPAVHHALLEYGLRYNAEAKQWEGFDYIISDEDLEDITLAEIDQIIAGLRDGRDEVNLGNDKYFHLR